jgi:hypothetical protein
MTGTILFTAMLLKTGIVSMVSVGQYSLVAAGFTVSTSLPRSPGLSEVRLEALFDWILWVDPRHAVIYKGLLTSACNVVIPVPHTVRPLFL